MHKFLDAEKALEVVVYVSHNTNNLFNLVKTLYYADKLHLERYGRLISGDTYIAMEDGPVPSGAYDFIKLVRGDQFAYDQKIIDTHPEMALRIEVSKDRLKTSVFPIRDPNLDFLSESDIECLKESIKLYANMGSNKLWDLVHQEKAYSKTDRNSPIPLRELIIEDVTNGKEVLEYLDS